MAVAFNSYNIEDRLCYAHVLICSKCYDKIPQTSWLINNRDLLFTVLEVRKSKIKLLAELVSDKGLLPGGLSFHCSLT